MRTSPVPTTVTDRGAGVGAGGAEVVEPTEAGVDEQADSAIETIPPPRSRSCLRFTAPW